MAVKDEGDPLAILLAGEKLEVLGEKQAEPLELRASSTRRLKRGRDWTQHAAYHEGVRRDAFGNKHPYDAAILQLGYGVYHHIDGVHRSRKRKTSAPYTKPGRVRVYYHPPQNTRVRLGSPEAFVREELQRARGRGWKNGDVPSRIQQFLASVDRTVDAQAKDPTAKTWVPLNMWARKRERVLRMCGVTRSCQQL